MIYKPFFKFVSFYVFNVYRHLYFLGFWAQFSVYLKLFFCEFMNILERDDVTTRYKVR